MTTNSKYLSLIDYMKKFDKIAVAFSGGVDSSFLLKVANSTIGVNSYAITFASPLFPKRELEFTKKYCKENKIRQIIVELGVEALKDISTNPKDRCYICKKNIFSSLLKRTEGAILFEGSNFDDKDDYRPGMRAIEELNILSPLKDCELTKKEIRELSKELNIPTHDKASFSCLATRIPYGNELTKEKLDKVDNLEQFLFENNFSQFRVRLLQDTAKIEVLKEDISRLNADQIYTNLVAHFKKYGIEKIIIDSEGYVMGKMNQL